MAAGIINKNLQAQAYNNAHETSVTNLQEGPIGDLSPHEEILYLRRHLAKLNRRVLNIEISNEQRMQRERLIYCMGLAYFVLKAIFWLNRSY